MTPLERLRAIDPAARARAARVGFWVVAGLLLLNLVFGDMGVLAGIRQRHAASQLRDEVATLQTEHDTLAADIQALNTNPFRIEAIAREELGLARPGEIIFLFPSGGGAVAPSSSGRGGVAPPGDAAPAPPADKPAAAKAPARPAPTRPTSARPGTRQHR